MRAQISPASASLFLKFVAMLCLLVPGIGLAENMSDAQRRAAEEFLLSVAGGGAPGLTYAIHPAELEELRTRLLNLMREEAKGGDSTIRSRLFGRAMPLADLERMTPNSFYGTLASRLSLFGRRYQKVKEVSAVPGPKGTVYALVRGVQPRESGDVEVVEVVKIRPYGKDWKATMPEELDAQIEDLIEGRRRLPSSVTQAKPPATPGAGTGAGTATPAPGTPPAAGASSGTAEVQSPPEIMELLTSAEKSLTEGKCDEYYKERMSKNFRRVTAKKALDSLISTCQRSTSTREMLLSTLKIVQGLEPKFEYGGQRAVYDLSGQGLPFDKFVLERVDKRWYIAE
jgi:hypothetical protein